MSEPSGADSNTRPSTSHVGRRITPSNISNGEENSMPDFEFFGAVPRSPPNLTDFLTVWSVDVLPGTDDINKKQHRTDLYESDNLIVRRGQSFEIRISFNRPYVQGKDKFWVEFLIGRYPNITKGTYIPIYLEEQLEQGKWGAKIMTTWQNTLSLSIMSPAYCPVGRFRMYVAIMTPYGIRRTARDSDTDLYILFNPWCSDDAVYMDTEAEKEEYILNDIGHLYYGEASEVVSRAWIFGQFESGVLDSCLYALDRARMPLQARGCPIKVCRVASAVINSLDEDGILVGSWTGAYGDGVAPTAWNSSVDILLQYFRTRQPVRYGQCWVFAAVFNTVLRCLGIPSRVITNYSSAHDNDGDLVTDVILDENGKKDLEFTKDSIWNYHCWNECWMSRADLPPGYGGWQAVDATPQETSGGMFRCGPASVLAIKHGQVFFPFDAPYIYAEVNSDVIYWTRHKDGTLTKADVKTDQVGKLILTQKIGTELEENITEQYKFPEGSSNDKRAQESAIQYGVKKEKKVIAKPMDVSLRVQVEEKILIGTGFVISLEFKNNSDEKRTVTVQLSGSVDFYTGVPNSNFIDQTLKVFVEPHQVQQAQVKIKPKDYVNRLVEQSTLSFLITGRVKENEQILVAKKIIALQIPMLRMKVEGPTQFGREVNLVTEFTNPLKQNLENVVLRLEGLGLLKPKIKFFSIILQNGTLTTSDVFVPWKHGPRKLVASLDCNLLRQVVGELWLTII
ncbi:coagulation factor XIII A chain [Callorhinchus milii]|nr:coagulation factor XIII A chain [Callorhinchus milii]